MLICFSFERTVLGMKTLQEILSDRENIAEVTFVSVTLFYNFEDRENITDITLAKYFFQFLILVFTVKHFPSVSDNDVKLSPSR